MNAVDHFNEDKGDPEIILVAIKRESYYLVEGEDFLNQLLLEDGTFPCPVQCLHFASKFAMREFVGEDVSLAQYWGVNPSIVERLRLRQQLVEIETSSD